MSRGFKITLAILVAVVIAVLIYLPFSPGGRQRINMMIAERELPRVKAIIDGDARFANVQVFVYTGQVGAIGLHGDVSSDGDLLALMRAVAEEQLPVPVAWQVTSVVPTGEAP